MYVLACKLGAYKGQIPFSPRKQLKKKDDFKTNTNPSGEGTHVPPTSLTKGPQQRYPLGPINVVTYKVDYTHRVECRTYISSPV